MPGYQYFHSNEDVFLKAQEDPEFRARLLEEAERMSRDWPEGFPELLTAKGITPLDLAAGSIRAKQDDELSRRVNRIVYWPIYALAAIVFPLVIYIGFVR